MAGGLLTAAILGKVVCGYAAGRGVNRLAIGIGTLPLLKLAPSGTGDRAAGR